MRQLRHRHRHADVVFERSRTVCIRKRYSAWESGSAEHNRCYEGRSDATADGFCSPSHFRKEARAVMQAASPGGRFWSTSRPSFRQNDQPQSGDSRHYGNTDHRQPSPIFRPFHCGKHASRFARSWKHQKAWPFAMVGEVDHDVSEPQRCARQGSLAPPHSIERFPALMSALPRTALAPLCAQ
jgi:hypothetical protein